MHQACKLLLIGTLLIAALFGPGNLMAATKTPMAPKEKKAKVYAKIAATDVAKNTVTITDTDGKDKVFAVDHFTTITIDGKPGKLADLTVGLKVDFMFSGTKLSSLDATQPPEPKKKK